MSAMIADLQLAVIGNCQISALIDRHASIVWCCLPRPDGDPVFSALLDTKSGDAASGVFSVTLADRVGSEQRYVPNTAIVETLQHDKHGACVRITDFCPRFRSRGRVFRPMSIVRMVEPVAGRPVITIRIRPTAGYGAVAATAGSGSHHLRFSANQVNYRITTDASLTALTEERTVVLEQALTFMLGPDETIDEPLARLAHGFLQETTSYWCEWVRTLAIPFDWQAAVIRAAITLKLCTFEDTGAVLAALTTSIPESAGTERNWDYRYCWLRDSYFVIQALNRLGATRTMEAYLHYIDHIVARSSAGDLQPLYGISGEAQMEEQIVVSLSGYRGMAPVRIGNAAATQIQHDVYGAVILASSQLFFDERLASRGDDALFERLQRLAERASSVYEQPDAGPWELRGKEDVHTFSAVISWAGCERLSRIAQRLGRTQAAHRWQSTAAQMRQRILARCWNKERQSFVSTFGGNHLDATLLLLPEFGLLPATDPRFVATVDAIGAELRVGDQLFRYRHADDFGEPKTAFAVCAFWYVNALAAVGRIDEARVQFEQLLARRNSLGLLSEDIDPVTGELWGNFPQTYSMVGIITSALRLSHSWEESL